MERHGIFIHPTRGSHEITCVIVGKHSQYPLPPKTQPPLILLEFAWLAHAHVQLIFPLFPVLLRTFPKFLQHVDIFLCESELCTYTVIQCQLYLPFLPYLMTELQQLMRVNQVLWEFINISDRILFHFLPLQIRHNRSTHIHKEYSFCDKVGVFELTEKQ